MLRRIFSIIALTALFLSTVQIASSVPIVVQKKDGSWDYIFDGGPGDPQGNNVIVCPSDSKSPCKTINSRGTLVGGKTVGSQVCLFVHTDAIDPNIGVGYINVTVDADYDTNIGGDFIYSQDVTQQVYTNLADWEAAVEIFNAAN